MSREQECRKAAVDYRKGNVMAGASLLDSDRSSLVFEELALPLLDSVYNFAYWLVQDRADAEDLVQETYLKAFRGFASFRPNTNFRAWILRILKNTFLTSRSKAQTLCDCSARLRR